jgi:ABC-2 type transport system permease protein
MTAALGFVLAVMLGLLLAASLVTLITISLLWTISGEGVARLGPPLIFLFSGLIVPLPLLPNWLQPLIGVLPFRALVDTPFRIYIGHLAGWPIALSLLHQALWILVFIGLGRLVLNRGLGRVVIQGG